MDQKRPYIFGSLQPCYDVNPKNVERVLRIDQQAYCAA